jgi:hypothetical protein
MQYTKTAARPKISFNAEAERRFDDGIFIASLAVKISWKENYYE